MVASGGFDPPIQPYEGRVIASSLNRHFYYIASRPKIGTFTPNAESIITIIYIAIST